MLGNTHSFINDSKAQKIIQPLCFDLPGTQTASLTGRSLVRSCAQLGSPLQRRRLMNSWLMVTKTMMARSTSMVRHLDSLIDNTVMLTLQLSQSHTINHKTHTRTSWNFICSIIINIIIESCTVQPRWNVMGFDIPILMVFNYSPGHVAFIIVLLLCVSIDKAEIKLCLLPFFAEWLKMMENVQ